MESTLIDLNQIFSMKPSVYEIFLSVKFMIKKTAENCRNIYDVEKRIVSKLTNIRIPNFDRQI